MSLDALANPAERLAVLPNAMNWRSTWNATTQYYVNDCVVSPTNGDVYLATTNILGGVDPALSSSVWTNLSGVGSQTTAMTFKGTFSTVVQYRQGDVTVGGFNPISNPSNNLEAYVCIVPLNTVGLYPPTTPNEWTQLSTQPVSTTGTVSVVSVLGGVGTSQTSNINLKSTTGTLTIGAGAGAGAGDYTITLGGGFANASFWELGAYYLVTFNLTVTSNNFNANPQSRVTFGWNVGQTIFNYFDIPAVAGGDWETTFSGIIQTPNVAGIPDTCVLNLSAGGGAGNTIDFTGTAVAVRLA